MVSAAEERKNEGNVAFKNQNYALAVEKYTNAIELDANNHIYYSNRSAAFAAMDDFVSAEKDAALCIRLNPNFVKGYHRHGIALKGLKQYSQAMQTLQAGQKIDFDNQDIHKLQKEIEPFYLAAEKSRRSKLSPAEQLKEQGNDAFKTAAYDKAIQFYTQAIEKCNDNSNELIISCYNNRAACHQQMSNFSAVVSDCTQVLERDTQNQKALLRRGLAYEGLERYRLALDDIRALLAIDSTIQVANKAQHRLGECVRRLRSDN